MHDILAIASGALVGFVLGLIGGGGSILAVPLLVYVVGVPSPHVAIGTGAVAVGLNALASLIGHARIGNVRWPCALTFAGSGIIGAAIGSTLGKHVDGQSLLTLFGVLMIVVAAMMLKRRPSVEQEFARLTSRTAGHLVPRLAGMGLGIGTLSGFFGIGGGFLIVPGLMAASGMPLIAAVGSSLVSVTAFGITTAINYAVSGLIDWRLVVMFVIGGTLGSIFGSRLATHLAKRRQTLSLVFAGIVASMGVYIVVRGLMGGAGH